MRDYIKAFWNCGDSRIVNLAIDSVELTDPELKILRLSLQACLTQEEIAEMLNLSPSYVQKVWYKATDKLLALPWVYCYGKELYNKQKEG